MRSTGEPAPVVPTDFDVFLSVNSVDQPIARELADAVELYLDGEQDRVRAPGLQRLGDDLQHGAGKFPDQHPRRHVQLRRRRTVRRGQTGAEGSAEGIVLMNRLIVASLNWQGDQPDTKVQITRTGCRRHPTEDCDSDITFYEQNTQGNQARN